MSELIFRRLGKPVPSSGNLFSIPAVAKRTFKTGSKVAPIL